MLGYRGVQITGTLTCGASGGANTASFTPAVSNAPFRDLSFTVVPIEDPSPYTVTVFHDGEVEETHIYPDINSRIICHMAFPNVIFPANIGTNAIPKYFANGRTDYYGVPISITIENHAAVQRSFYVYACFAAFESFAFGEITKV